jgi:hypothetical protein
MISHLPLGDLSGRIVPCPATATSPRDLSEGEQAAGDVENRSISGRLRCVQRDEVFYVGSGRIEAVTEANGSGAPGARAEWRWDVALSFADAQRDYVDQVAQALKVQGVRCFYDADEEIDMWGKYPGRLQNR